MKGLLSECVRLLPSSALTESLCFQSTALLCFSTRWSCFFCACCPGLAFILSPPGSHPPLSNVHHTQCMTVPMSPHMLDFDRVCVVCYLSRAAKCILMGVDTTRINTSRCLNNWCFLFFREGGRATDLQIAHWTSRLSDCSTGIMLTILAAGSVFFPGLFLLSKQCLKSIPALRWSERDAVIVSARWDVKSYCLEKKPLWM